ncbi:MAG: phosphoribosylformylglycinamidine synthase II, partial [Rhodospirillaceae bacterium]|nr:phosphoribosylformylglycinamidine synthase II [Rhodospirillaceae bacterium]
CSKGNTGIELNLDNIPTREKDMSAYEIMLSESQERMLMVLKPGSESEAQKIFKKWELDFAVVGEITNTGRMILLQENEIVADLPIDPLAEASPEYDRPWLPSIKKNILAPNKLNSQSWRDSLKKMVCSPDLASRRWIWEQYDHMVMGDTVQRPGGDAAIIRIHNSNRGLAMTTDCTPRYVNADPLEGGKQAVAEACRNLSAVGARPLAITDNLNFGNPEKPEIMGQLVQAIQGIGEACKVLDCPVVSGNVSLYNETDGKSILPTPAIGAIGIIDSLDQTTSSFFKAENEDIVLLGDNNNYKTGWVGQSLYARVVHKIEDGAPPPVDLNHEKAMGAAVRKLIKDSTVTSCHDVADGGLLITVLEMALSANIGFELSIPEPISLSWLFGEDQGRYIITCKKETTKTVIQYFKDIELSAQLIGQTGGDKVQINGDQCISLEILNTLHEDWLPTYMAA